MTEIGARPDGIKGFQETTAKKQTDKPLSHKVQDALENKRTRREVLGGFLASALAATTIGTVVREGAPEVYQPEPQLPQSTPSPEPTPQSHYELDTTVGRVDQDTYKELQNHNARFARFDKDRGWVDANEPVIKRMVLSPEDGKLIVRHGPHFGDNYDEVSWDDYIKTNPDHIVYTTDIVGDQYYSLSGQGQIHLNGSDGYNGIWPAIVNKTHTEDGMLRFSFSSIYGEKIAEEQEPDCVSASFATNADKL